MQLSRDEARPRFRGLWRGPAYARRLHVPDAAQELRFVLDAIRLVRKQLAGRVPLIGFCGAPWTLAAYMIEGKTSRSFEKAKAALMGDPRLAHALLSKNSDALIRYLNAQLAACAQAVAICCSWAGALGPEDYARFGAP